MLTNEEFDSLEVGDHVETYPLFPGLTRDLVVLQVIGVQDGSREFMATYCGITIGRWLCIKCQGGLKWQF
jgi:hypothetical protein